MKKNFCLLILIVFCNMVDVKAQFNMSFYRQLPPLYRFDDYDACLHHEETTGKIDKYCMVYAEIIPNTSSGLWQSISSISADPRHFRHDLLYRGICVKHCRALFQRLSRFYMNQLYTSRINDTQIAAYYTDVHKRSTDDHIRLEHVVNSCLNYEFQHKYNLSLRTNIEYCEKTRNLLEHDWLDIIFYNFLFLLALLTVLSSFLDYLLKLKQPLSHQNNNFYKTELESRSLRLLTAFSICRNYYQLMLNSINPARDELKGLNLLRVIGAFLVIFSHALLLGMAIPIENPEFFERYFHRSETIIIENGAAIIQIFFVMSGFLLYVNFTSRKLVTVDSSIKKCILVYFQVFIYRYLRLIPSLIIVILFNATILIRLQDGPYWRHLAEAEHIFCRENWWKNLFFINNYMMERSCLHQTWYLAADMQLFELFLIILITTAKYPLLKKIVFACLFALSILIPGFIVYHLKLDPIYRSYPESYRYMFFKNSATFYQTYTPFYTNIGSYLFGILSGEQYLRCVKNIKFSNMIFKYRLSWWLIFPTGFGLVFFGELFMSDTFERPSIWVAVFSGLYKNVWAFMCSVLLLGLCFKFTWLLYELSRLQIFHVLAKLSYQSFLWHALILRLLVGFYRQPIYVNRLFMFWYTVAAFVLTQILSFLLALLVELPTARVIKYFLGNFTGTPANKTTDGNINENLPLS